MDFFYVSLFSIVPLGIAYSLLGLLYLAIALGMRGVHGRKVFLPVLGVVFLILPISEELWVAWHFSNACKGAGLFIYKKVKADGFYNETGGGSLDLLRQGQYRFIESRTDRGVTHVTLGDATLTREALARFSQDNVGRDPSSQDVVRVKLDDRTEALVFPKKDVSWRVTRLEHPTARYHFSNPYSHTPVAYKIRMFEYLVRDVEANEVLARERTYAREAPWYFISLDNPTMFCSVSGRSGEKMHATLYDLVLQPLEPR